MRKGVFSIYEILLSEVSDSPINDFIIDILQAARNMSFKTVFYKSQNVSRLRWKAPQKKYSTPVAFLPAKYERMFKGFLYPIGGKQ